MMSIYEKREFICKQVLNAAFKVHTALGAGLLESTYEKCLTHELRKEGLLVENQKPLPIQYDGVLIDAAYRIDLLVDKQLIVELKATNEMHPIYFTQMLTYLKHTNLTLGLLLNFNVKSMKDGIERIVNNHYKDLI